MGDIDTHGLITRQYTNDRLDELEAGLGRVLDERDRLEAAIDRHRADYEFVDGDERDAALYATLREIRDERLAAAPGGRDEGRTE